MKLETIFFDKIEQIQKNQKEAQRQFWYLQQGLQNKSFVLGSLELQRKELSQPFDSSKKWNVSLKQKRIIALVIQSFVFLFLLCSILSFSNIISLFKIIGFSFIASAINGVFYFQSTKENYEKLLNDSMNFERVKELEEKMQQVQIEMETLHFEMVDTFEQLKHLQKELEKYQIYFDRIKCYFEKRQQSPKIHSTPKIVSSEWSGLQNSEKDVKKRSRVREEV